MELSNIIGAGCLITGLVQSWGTILQWLDHQERQKELEAEGKVTVKLPSKFVSLLLAVGAAGAFILAGWMFFATPLRPTTVEVQKIVEVPAKCPACPICPPAKSGTVTQKGGKGNIGNTGSDVHINDPKENK